MIIPKNSIIVIIPIYTPIIPMIFPLYHCNPKKNHYCDCFHVYSHYFNYIPIIFQLYSHGNHQSGILYQWYSHINIPVAGLSIDIDMIQYIVRMLNSYYGNINKPTMVILPCLQIYIYIYNVKPPSYKLV